MKALGRNGEVSEVEGASGEPSIAQAKRDLLNWSIAVDRHRNRRLMWGMALAGGAVAMVGCSALVCMPTSRARMEQAVRRPARAMTAHGVWRNVAILLQVYRLTGPMLMGYLQQRALRRKSAGKPGR